MSEKEEKKKAMLKALFGDEESKIPEGVEVVTDDDLTDFINKWVREEPNNPDNGKLTLECAEGYFECDVVSNHGPCPITAKVTYAQMKGMPGVPVYVAPIICCTTCLVKNAMFHTYALHRNLVHGNGPIKMSHKH